MVNNRAETELFNAVVGGGRQSVENRRVTELNMAEDKAKKRIGK